MEDQENNERANLVAAYLEQEPTPETNAEIITQLGQDFDMSPNKVKVILVQESVFIRKEVSDVVSSTPKRASKSAAVQELKELLEAKGKPVDEELIGKMTAKAIVYVTSLLRD